MIRILCRLLIAIVVATAVSAVFTSCGHKDGSDGDEDGEVLTLSLDELSSPEESGIGEISEDISQDVSGTRPAADKKGSDLPDAEIVNSDMPEIKLPAKNGNIKKGPRHHERIPIYLKGRLADIFNDSNKYQYQYAERLGITPIRSLSQAYNTRRPLVKVTSNAFYQVDTLTHSLPFLVPEAERLLRRIGANFIDSLGRRGADGYKIIVTSLLRTPNSVKHLRRVNVNATDSSTHQFATTFDLTYTRFHCADTTRTINTEDLKNLLGEVLLDLRRQNKCMVKFERKTGCYHITVTQ